MTKDQRALLRAALSAGRGYVVSVGAGGRSGTRTASSLVKAKLLAWSTPRARQIEGRRWITITEAGVKAALRRTRAERDASARRAVDLAV